MTLEKIAELVGGEIRGDSQKNIEGAASSGRAGAREITFVTDRRHLDEALESDAGAIILERKLFEEHFGPDGGKSGASKSFILVEANPRLAFARVLEEFRPREAPRRGIHPTSVVGPDVVMGRDVYLGPHVVVEAGVRLGDGVRLYPNVYVGENSSIGDNSIIYPNVVIRERVTIGRRVIIHPGCVIGADGFGYVEDGTRRHKIPQIGSVVIEDDVEIGANSCIDRAMLDETRIGRGTKIDNLVQVGHNVIIGENVVIAGLSGIGGSTRIEDGVTIGGHVAVSDHVVIGKGAIVGGNACVWSNIPPGAFVSGDPARPHKEHLRVEAAVRKLPDALNVLWALEEKLNDIERRGRAGPPKTGGAQPV